MSQNLTLKNLNDAVNAVFYWKQRAWEKQEDSFRQKRATQRSQQLAWEEQQAAWEARMRIKTKHNERIMEINTLIDEKFKERRKLYAEAKLAYNQNRHRDAKSFSARARECSQDIEDLRAERESLLDEIRQARKKHESAKSVFEAAKRSYIAAKAKLGRARKDFELAKATHSVAQEEFNRIFREIKAINVTNRLQIAKSVGVPVDYLYEEMIYIKTKYDGQIDILVYPGGSHGDDHGHYVLDCDGRLTYARPPGTPHGSHNYVQ